MIPKIAAIYPLPHGGVDINTALMSLVDEADSQIPMAVVGILGRATLPFLTTLFDCSSIIDQVTNSSMANIHAIYFKPLNTMFLLLTSALDSGFNSNILNLHETMLDSHDAITEATFIILNSCHIVYLVDDVPRFDFSHMKLFRRISDLKKTMASHLISAAEASINNDSKTTHPSKIPSRLAPGKTIPIITVVLPDHNEKGRTIRSSTHSRSFLSLVNSVKSIVGGLNDILFLDSTHPLIILNYNESELLIGSDHSLLMSQFFEEEEKHPHKEETLNLFQMREHLMKSILQLQVETLYFSKGSSSRRNNVNLTDVIIPMKNWVSGFTSIIASLKDSKVANAMRNFRRENGVNGRWSTSRIEAFLPAAISTYKSNLPQGLVNTKQHEIALSLAIQNLEKNAGRLGPTFSFGCSSLESSCRSIFVSIQSCDAISILGNPCNLPFHKAQISHNTGVNLKYPCACGKILCVIEDDLFLTNNVDEGDNLSLMINGFNSIIEKECCKKTSSIVTSNISGFYLINLQSSDKPVHVNGEGLIAEHSKKSIWNPFSTINTSNNVVSNKINNVETSSSSITVTRKSSALNKSNDDKASISEWPELMGAKNSKVETVNAVSPPLNEESANSLKNDKNQIQVGMEYVCNLGHRFLVDCEDKVPLRTWPAGEYNLNTPCLHPSHTPESKYMAQLYRIYFQTNFSLEINMDVQFNSLQKNVPPENFQFVCSSVPKDCWMAIILPRVFVDAKGIILNQNRNAVIGKHFLSLSS